MQSGCVICYDSFEAPSDANNEQNDDEVRIVATSCGHVFHNNCIQQWLRQSHTCPECRRPNRNGNLTKLFINFCIENRSDNIPVESLDALQIQLCEKDLECVEKEKKIIGLEIDYAVSQRKIEGKGKEIEELQACFANSELQSLQKDGKIKELETCVARLEQESLAKDEKIQDLRTNCTFYQKDTVEKIKRIEELHTMFTQSELGSLEKEEKITQLQTYYTLYKQECQEKDEKIKELQTCSARFELESLKKEEKIEDLVACSIQSDREKDEMLEERRKLYTEISTMKLEVERLSHVDAENQKLLQEKNSLQSEKNILLCEREHLNAVKTIMEGSSSDVDKILEDVHNQISSEEKKGVPHHVATYCSLLKKELDRSQEDKTHLENELTKVKQELNCLKNEKNSPIKLKLTKHRIRTPLSDYLKRRKLGEEGRKLGEKERKLGEKERKLGEKKRKLREKERKVREKERKLSGKLKKLEGLSWNTNPVPILLRLPSNPCSQCCSLDEPTSVSKLSDEISSGCKNQVTGNTKDFPKNKKRKINISAFVKKPPEVSTRILETPVLRVANNALSAQRKKRCNNNEDSVSCVGYNGLANHFPFVSDKVDEPCTIQKANYVILLN